MPSRGEPSPPRGRGRPRSAPSKGPGLSTRDEILEAASALFSTQGYDATTTRQIADAVGIKQASLYYHFPDKSTILRSLLKGTVAPSVQFAEWLAGTRAPATVQLCALARFDVAGLLRDQWNLHVVYRLIDIAETEFQEARDSQVRLQGHYRRLTAAALAETVGPDVVADADLDLAFGLVEGLIAQRQWGAGMAREAYADAVVRGCLRLAGVAQQDIAETGRQAAVLVGEHALAAPSA